MSLLDRVSFSEGDLAAAGLPPAFSPPPGLGAPLLQQDVVSEAVRVQQQWQQLLGVASAPASLPGPSLAPLAAPRVPLRPPPGLLPPPPGLLPPPPPAVAQPPHLDLALAFMAGATFARASMQLGKGNSDSSSTSCGQSSETCSTADTDEEVHDPQITPLAAHSALELKRGMSETELSEQEVPEPPMVLELSAAIAAPLLPCVPGCPSVGSVGHHVGLCKPCDFVGRGFECRQGADCTFCHVCGPEERKARKAQRRKLVRAMARSGSTLA